VKQYWTYVEALAGEAPGPLHPRGTVLILESAVGQLQPTLSEWDLMSGLKVRSVAVPRPPELLLAEMVRAGDRIHVVTYAKPNGELWYLRFTPSLQLEAQERLGTVDGMSVASDGSIVAIMWAGTREGGGDAVGWQLATMDGAGRRLGGALMSNRNVFGGPTLVAVVGRKVYVLLNDVNHAFPPIVRLSEDARIEDQHEAFSGTPDQGVSLVAWAGKLLTIDGCYLEKVNMDFLHVGESRAVPPKPRDNPWCLDLRVASDGAGRLVTSEGDILSASLDLERHFAPYDGRGAIPLWVGPIPVLLSGDTKTGRFWLTWSD
jgi:hypothetical protein